MTAVFAHRGLHTRARENTLAAFSGAVALGVDGVELDVRRCSDGELVVHHDPRINGLAIAEQTSADLPAYVPSLADALAACAGRRVNVEVKNLLDALEASYDASGDFAREVVRAVDAAGRANDVIYSSFDLATCEVLADAGSSPVGWLLDVDVEPVGAIVRAAAAGLDAINPFVGVVDAALVDRARDVGLALNVWTVNVRDDLVAMLALGVDVVITDEPALAMALRDQGPDGPRGAMT